MPWVFLCFWLFWLCVVLLNAIHAIRSSSPFWAIFFFVVGLLWFLQPFCWWAAFWAELCIHPFKSVNLCEALVVRFRLSRLLFPLLYWEMRGKTSQVFSLIFEMHESLASFPNSLFPNHYFVCKYLCGNESGNGTWPLCDPQLPGTSACKMILLPQREECWPKRTELGVGKWAEPSQGHREPDRKWLVYILGPPLSQMLTPHSSWSFLPLPVFPTHSFIFHLGYFLNTPLLPCHHFKNPETLIFPPLQTKYFE